MKKIVCICLLLSSFLGQSQTTVTKNLGDYKILKVYNGIELELIKSTEAKLIITGKKSEMVKIKNVDNTLKICLATSPLLGGTILSTWQRDWSGSIIRST